MNAAPFTDEEAHDFWAEAQSEIYGEGAERSPDMTHAASGEQFVRWLGWVKEVEGTPVGDFDLNSCYNILEGWLLYPFAHPNAQLETRRAAVLASK